ncbi:hypothetical protein [Lonomia obliqua multiple nucleopolyhedrovirus]|uniref:Uncharacterized protein n=1 Tax=Lonomia obliqua multiple nucleopolyhedrovirus TaxID=134394 RepID=A0A126FC82_9ABAC|nr:hypothetical protein [Lonomia obliqua multiple nucleopolyhedrovirus]AKN80983.1 hypothetical protein [Lonomia obliqua multiple nucleopolyhedrovirus]
MSKIDFNIKSKTLNANIEEYTVDGLRLKPQYILYYKHLNDIVNFMVMHISKELNMREYDQVYYLGRQLYELLRSIYIDEPFKLWIKLNTDNLNGDEQFKIDVFKQLEENLVRLMSDKTEKKPPIQNVIKTFLNTQLSIKQNDHDDDSDHFQRDDNGYIKSECIVETYNCCNLIFTPINSL